MSDTKRLHVKLDFHERYPHPLQMYLDYPHHDILLNELESMCQERLRILFILEKAEMLPHKRFSSQWTEYIKLNINKDVENRFYKLFHWYSPTIDYNIRYADHVSHSFLKLVFCKNRMNAMWFKKREIDLFQIRFKQLSAQSVDEFLKLNKLNIPVISTTEKAMLREQLIGSTTNQKEDFDSVKFYKVPFQDACMLLPNLEVYLKAGIAYIPGNKLYAPVMQVFGRNFKQTLNVRIVIVKCNLN